MAVLDEPQKPSELFKISWVRTKTELSTNFIDLYRLFLWDGETTLWTVLCWTGTHLSLVQRLVYHSQWLCQMTTYWMYVGCVLSRLWQDTWKYTRWLWPLQADLHFYAAPCCQRAWQNGRCLPRRFLSFGLLACIGFGDNLHEIHWDPVVWTVNQDLEQELEGVLYALYTQEQNHAILASYQRNYKLYYGGKKAFKGVQNET